MGALLDEAVFCVAKPTRRGSELSLDCPDVDVFKSEECMASLSSALPWPIPAATAKTCVSLLVSVVGSSDPEITGDNGGMAAGPEDEMTQEINLRFPMSLILRRKILN